MYKNKSELEKEIKSLCKSISNHIPNHLTREELQILIDKLSIIDSSIPRYKAIYVDLNLDKGGRGSKNFH